MASKNSIYNGLIEKLSIKKLLNLTFDAIGNLRVIVTPSGTQAVSGTLGVTQSTTPWAVAEGNLTQSGTSQMMSQQLMQTSFRRNLIVS